MLALLYDVHGNLAALEAVLRDADAQGCDSFLLGGDYALFGPQPRETVERLESLANAEWIRGNVDRWTASPGDAPGDEVVQGALESCRAELGEELVARLAALPEQTVRDGTRYCHASPISDVRSFMPEPGDDEEELLGEVKERRVVFGHTHLPFRRECTARAGIELLNPGSVGLPFDGDTRAAYAVVRDDGSVEHRRVGYDSPEAAAKSVRERFGPGWAQTVARRIELARFAV